MATKQGSSLQRHSRRHHGSPFNRRTLFHSAEVIPTVALRLLYYSCFLCLILNTKCDFAMVQASYSDADDLINELDRPSKYQTLGLPFVPLLGYHFSPDPLKWVCFVCARAHAAAHSMNYTIKISANATNANPFVIISTLHRTHDRDSFFFVFVAYKRRGQRKDRNGRKMHFFKSALFSWSIETAKKRTSLITMNDNNNDGDPTLVINDCNYFCAE